MTLTGGYDSRAILIHLKDKKNINTITWGKKDSEYEKLTDASVAKELANFYQTNHTYLEINNSETEPEIVLDRFIKNGEGRIDHISGYLDGFKLWENLNRECVLGLIRGDEGFGWTNVKNESNVIDKIGITTLNEFNNIPSWFIQMLPKHEIPENLKRTKDETIETWRDRLYHEFRIPVILAALTQLKSNYIEIVNPLLNRLIINEVRSQPDKFRNNKLLFKELVDEKSPNIPYAKYPSTVMQQNYLKNEEVVSLFKSKFEENKGNLIPKEITQFLIKKMEVKSDISKGDSLKKIIRSYVPENIKLFLKDKLSKNIDFNILAFRVYIILRMHEILVMDSKAIEKYNKLKGYIEI